MVNDMTIKEIAKAFDMNVKQFSEWVGYSRQALYCYISWGGNRRRANAMKEQLALRSQLLYEIDLATAERKLKHREEAIEAIAAMMNGGKDNG